MAPWENQRRTIFFFNLEHLPFRQAIKMAWSLRSIVDQWSAFSIELTRMINCNPAVMQNVTSALALNYNKRISCKFGSSWYLFHLDFLSHISLNWKMEDLGYESLRKWNEKCWLVWDIFCWDFKSNIGEWNSLYSANMVLKVVLNDSFLFLSESDSNKCSKATIFRNISLYLGTNLWLEKY